MMTSLENVYSREKISNALYQNIDDLKQQFKSYSLDEFYVRPGDKWSACDTLRHLTKSVKTVSFAMKLPKFVLKFAFGRSEGKSRKYLEVKEIYLKKLGRGAQAGRFAPRHFDIPPAQADAEKLRKKTIRKWRRTCKELIRTLNKWSNHELDKYQLPHPIIGKITVREMLLFTLYHNLHHMRTIKRRVKATKGKPL